MCIVHHQTDLGRFIPRTFHPRMLQPPKSSPQEHVHTPDCSPPRMFTLQKVHRPESSPQEHVYPPDCSPRSFLRRMIFIDNAKQLTKYLFGHFPAFAHKVHIPSPCVGLLSQQLTVDPVNCFWAYCLLLLESYRAVESEISSPMFLLGPIFRKKPQLDIQIQINICAHLFYCSIHP